MIEMHPSVLTLKEYRVENRLPISALAEKLGVMNSRVVRLLNGSLQPGANMVMKISELVEPAPEREFVVARCPFMRSRPVAFVISLRRSAGRVSESVFAGIILYLLGFQ